MSNEFDVKRYPCPCCGYLTLSSPEYDSYDICPICYWEDDVTQMNDPNAAGGANRVNLNEARKNFLNFGASEKEWLAYVRSPLPEEKNN